jgi:hypothetical protein
MPYHLRIPAAEESRRSSGLPKVSQGADALRAVRIAMDARGHGIPNAHQRTFGHMRQTSSRRMVLGYGDRIPARCLRFLSPESDNLNAAAASLLVTTGRSGIGQ